MIKVIGINGKIKHGKDTFCDLVTEQLEAKGYKVTKAYFATALKKAAMSIFGLSDEDVYTQEGKSRKIKHLDGLTPRYILQKFGTNVARMIMPNIWVWNTMKTIQKMDMEQMELVRDGKEQTLHVIFVPDVRFANEFWAIKELNGTAIRVERPGFKVKEHDHFSEWGCDKYPYVDNFYNPLNWFRWLWYFAQRGFKPLILPWDHVYANSEINGLTRDAEAYADELIEWLKEDLPIRRQATIDGFKLLGNLDEIIDKPIEVKQVS